MEIAENRVKAVLDHFHSSLEDLYDHEEINAIALHCFREKMGYSASDFATKRQERLSESMLVEFEKMIKKLAGGMPVQYVTGYAWFYNMRLKVNEHVLIPRPETEELADLIIRENKEKKNLNVLDIGTGSGCIALALKKNLNQVIVDATDISAQALELAEYNALQNKIQVNFFLSDVLEDKETYKSSYDIIVSNPPYVRISEKGTIHKNVLDHEPHLALFVKDEDPLLFYRAISSMAGKRLLPGGRLYFEINEKLGTEVELLLKSKGFKDVTIKKDMSGKNRFIVAFT